MDFKLTSKRAYIRAIKRALRRNKFSEVQESEKKIQEEKPREEDIQEEKVTYTVSSAKENCDYCVEFKNLKPVEFFNKVKTTYKLLDCDNYPPSLVIKNEKQWKKLKLNSDQYYYIKPKYGSQCKNISIAKGKEVIINNQDSINNFPFCLQEEIIPKLDDYGRKYDYKTFVLYVKENDIISVYYAPEHLKRYCKDKYDDRTKDSFFSYDNCEKLVIENTSKEIEECLSITQKYILPQFDNINQSNVEYFLTCFDLIEDRNGKFWIMEINADPNFFQFDCVKKSHQKIFKDIVNSIKRHKENGKIEFDYFIKIS